MPRAQNRRLPRQREDRDAADRVEGGGGDERLAVADHERERVDPGAEIEHAKGESRPAGRHAVRDQTEDRGLNVVYPGPEEVLAAERTPCELVATGVDRDVVRLRAWEDGRRGADVEWEVDTSSC